MRPGAWAVIALVLLLLAGFGRGVGHHEAWPRCEGPDTLEACAEARFLLDLRAGVLGVASALAFAGYVALAAAALQPREVEPLLVRPWVILLLLGVGPVWVGLGEFATSGSYTIVRGDGYLNYVADHAVLNTGVLLMQVGQLMGLVALGALVANRVAAFAARPRRAMARS